MVSSVTHRSVLDKVPIREDLQYAEDDEWTRRLVEGYEIPYAIESVAMHSHNYTLRQSYKRSFGDSKAMAATSTVPPRNVNYHYFVGTRPVQGCHPRCEMVRQKWPHHRHPPCGGHPSRPAPRPPRRTS
jgi:hypothetical protein